MDSFESILERLQMVLAALGFAFFTFAAAWKNHFFYLPEDPFFFIPRVRFWQVALGFLIYLGMQLLAAPLVLLAFMAFEGGRWPGEGPLELDIMAQGWYNICVIIMAASALGVFASKLEQGILYYIWNGRKSGFIYRFKDFCIGAAAWLLAYPTVVIFGQIIAILVAFKYQNVPVDQVAVKQLRMIGEFPVLFYITSALIVTIIPVIEEFLFRGLMQTWLKGICGVRYAILLTALVFSLFHFSTSQGVANGELLVSLFILGCFLGYVFERQRSLWASIGLHATFNIISIFMILVV